jgi:hypothetical protein
VPDLMDKDEDRKDGNDIEAVDESFRHRSFRSDRSGPLGRTLWLAPFQQLTSLQRRTTAMGSGPAAMETADCRMYGAETVRYVC